MYFLPIENNASFFNAFLIIVSFPKLSDRAVPSFLLKTKFLSRCYLLSCSFLFWVLTFYLLLWFEDGAGRRWRYIFNPLHWIVELHLSEVDFDRKVWRRPHKAVTLEVGLCNDLHWHREVGREGIPFKGWNRYKGRLEDFTCPPLTLWRRRKLREITMHPWAALRQGEPFITQ